MTISPSRQAGGVPEWLIDHWWLEERTRIAMMPALNATEAVGAASGADLYEGVPAVTFTAAVSATAKMPSWPALPWLYLMVPATGPGMKELIARPCRSSTPAALNCQVTLPAGRKGQCSDNSALDYLSPAEFEATTGKQVIKKVA
jgi:hypothetical protein